MYIKKYEYGTQKYKYTSPVHHNVNLNRLPTNQARQATQTMGTLEQVPLYIDINNVTDLAYPSFLWSKTMYVRFNVCITQILSK